MATNLRKAPGMREKQPEVWELVVEAGIHPVTGKPRQVSRTFRGTMRDAKKARALLLTEVEKGRHTGTAATVDQQAIADGRVAYGARHAAFVRILVHGARAVDADAVAGREALRRARPLPSVDDMAIEGLTDDEWKAFEAALRDR